MLARTLLDEHYRDFAKLTLAIADVLAAQVRDLSCACVQVDEANIPGNPADGPLAAEAINRVLDAVQRGEGGAFLLRQLRRPDDPEGRLGRARFPFSTVCTPTISCSNSPIARASDLEALKDMDPRIGIGLGVMDIKVNHVETPDEIARAIERAEKVLGPDRVR